MNNARTLILAVCLGVLTTSQTVAAQRSQLDREQFLKDIAALTRHPHRLPGMGSEERIAEVRRRVEAIDQTADADLSVADIFRETADRVLGYLSDPSSIPVAPGSLAASRHVQLRLTEIRDGISVSQREHFEIYTQGFDTVVPTTTECRLVLDGAEYPLFAAAPNALVARVTPADGLTGPLLYAGTGTLAEYGHRDPNGALVVLDFDGDWQTAFAFGARAVLIIGDFQAEQAVQYSLTFPANLPVFVMAPEVAESLDVTGDTPKAATVFAACEWKRLRGRNVIAIVRGTEPQLGEVGKGDQALVLAASLDSYSEVPALAPGARDAANAAALLQLAEHFARSRPKRDIVLAFFDGQTLYHQGARAFYSAVGRPRHKDIANKHLAAGTSLDERKEMIVDEFEFLDYAGQILSQDNIFKPDVEEMRDRRKVLLKAAAVPIYLEIGPMFSGWGFAVFTIVATLCAAVLIIVNRKSAKANVPLAAASRIVTVVTIVMLTGLIYGGLFDPLMFDTRRGDHERSTHQETERIDILTERIEGLEGSHRRTMDLLKDLARRRNSDVLEALRPMRTDVQRLERDLGRELDGRDELPDLA
ncbi:MAG: M28 family peptidase, partial [Planctomycetota bacterium]